MDANLQMVLALSTYSHVHLVKAREEMIYFKRELLNREENFNKRFGASPNVGVMQVVKPQQGQVGGGVGSKVGMGSIEGWRS